MKTLSVILCLLLSQLCLATEPLEAYKLATEKKAVIVDVREFKELSSGLVKDAMWFPKSIMEKDPESVDDFRRLVKGKKVFLYCKGGKRAAECVQTMRHHGIEAESIGGFDQLKLILPTEQLHSKMLKLQEPQCVN